MLTPPPTDWLILGAGISGLVAGSFLLKAGQTIQILEKSKGVGGRLATRRISLAEDPKQVITFNHGLRFIELRQPETFQILNEILDPFTLQGWTRSILRKSGEPESQRISPSPGINSLPKALPAARDVQKNRLIAKICYDSSQKLWQAMTSEGIHYSARQILCSFPIPQTVEILKNSPIEFETPLPSEIIQSQYQPTLVVLIVLRGSRNGGRSGHSLDASSNHSLVIAPQDETQDSSTHLLCLTLYLSPESSERLLSESESVILHYAIGQIKNLNPTEITQFQVHRWRYAQPKLSLKAPFLALPAKNAPQSSPLYLIGDYFGSSQLSPLERAIQSGHEVARNFMTHLPKKNQ